MKAKAADGDDDESDFDEDDLMFSDAETMAFFERLEGNKEQRQAEAEARRVVLAEEHAREKARQQAEIDKVVADIREQQEAERVAQDKLHASYAVEAQERLSNLTFGNFAWGGGT